MSRFIDDVTPEIAEVIELHNYVRLKDLIEKAKKVERQLKIGYSTKS